MPSCTEGKKKGLLLRTQAQETWVQFLALSESLSNSLTVCLVHQLWGQDLALLPRLYSTLYSLYRSQSQLEPLGTIEIQIINDGRKAEGEERLSENLKLVWTSQKASG